MNENVSDQEKRVKKVGIIGCGGIAQVHAWALCSMDDIELRAFCDIDENKAKALADKVGDIYRARHGQKDGWDWEYEICEDWEELGDSDLDVIHVCTPHYLHARMAIELLKKGKAVFVEKPCAISREEFLELKAADARTPGRLGFCFQNRYNETTLLIDQIIKEGRIGKITGGRAMVTWRRDKDYYDATDWKGKIKTEGGGVLINQAIHTLDLLLRHLGNPVTVRGMASNHHLLDQGVEVEDSVEAWMEFSGGKRACFHASNAYVTDAPIYLEFQGEEGRVCMNGTEITVYAAGETPRHFMRDLEKGMGKDYWGCGHKACIKDFYQCLDGAEPYQNCLNGVENTFLTIMRIYEDARRTAKGQ